MRLLRREEGVSIVELAFVLPIFLIVLAVTVPIVKAGWDYVSLTNATAHGVRYASRADVNARESPDGLTRRPTAEEVEAFVREAAGGLDLSQVTVSPEPSRALPGETITVSATHEFSFGPLGDLANTVKDLFFGGGAYLPESKSITVSSTGREE